MLSRKVLVSNWGSALANSSKASSRLQNVRFANTDPPQASDENKPVPKKDWGQFATKEEVHRWRTHPNRWHSAFENMKIKEPKVQILEFVSSRKGKLKEIWQMRHEIAERESQVYNPKIQDFFGPELGCAYFFAHRNAAVKFHNNETWYSKENKSAQMPNQYKKGWYIEKIDCENMKRGGLRYEGLNNVSGLKNLKWFSLKGNKFINDWAIDRLVSHLYKTLEYLDISDCSVTHRGLIALYKMQNLKLLVLDSASSNENIETVSSLLESSNPNLLVKFV